MRIFAISDLHIDYQANRQWLLGLSEFDYQQDVLILAGDVSDKEAYLLQAFEKLKRSFKAVLFVPGNHDLWVGVKPAITSLDKFWRLMSLAENCGVLMRALHTPVVSIIPLFSWYDGSFGEIDEYLQKRWMDFFLCHWPEPFSLLSAFSEREQRINDYFLALNEPLLESGREFGSEVISFSHFLPRIDVMPNYIPRVHQRLYPVLGSNKLDEQIRRLGASLHVYGHSHVNRHECIGGVTYINNAYGNPGEGRISAKSLKCIAEY